jgi:hypothetical protein
MFRPLLAVVLLAGPALAEPPNKSKDSYPESQQEVLDRLAKIEAMYRDAGMALTPGLRQLGLDRVTAEANALRRDIAKQLMKTGVTDWVVKVTAVDDDNVHFEVGPGLSLKVARPGMDGLTILAVRKLVVGQKVTVRLAPALIAECLGEGVRLVAVVGGKHLTIVGSTGK